MQNTCIVGGVLGEGLPGQQGEHKEHRLKLHRAARAVLAVVLNPSDRLSHREK